MNFPFYRGDGTSPPNPTPAALPISRRGQLLKAENYLADPGLVDACNVALLLGQPLLLTGEPGVGKTQLAYSLAWELGLDTPLKFETKSTSAARDLFYTYDALRRFHDAQSHAPTTDALPYLSYQALGKAILYTHERAAVAKWLPPAFLHPGKRRSVVLIDEIDKAPRDLPNDILNELELMYFRIPELGHTDEIKIDPALQPIVIFTSNSEKDLPDAFLRRCIYYNIPFPDRSRLLAIVTQHLGQSAGDSSAFLQDALALFAELRAPGSGLRKQPATAELLGWLLTLRELGGQVENPIADSPALVLRTLSNLVKTAEDQPRAMELVQRWLKQHTP